MAALYGRAGRITAQNVDFGPGQSSRSAPAAAATSHGRTPASTTPLRRTRGRRSPSTPPRLSPVRARPEQSGWLSACSVLYSESIWSGTFVWARRALNRPEPRFPGGAVVEFAAEVEHEGGPTDPRQPRRAISALIQQEEASTGPCAWPRCRSRTAARPLYSGFTN
jgi:hypothetical protein